MEAQWDEWEALPNISQDEGHQLLCAQRLVINLKA